MDQPVELSAEECERLLRSAAVARVALCTPSGPHIVPVNYAVSDGSVVFATSAYSELGQHGRDARLAFELDHIDYERHHGWSVVARGRGEMVTDPDEVARLRTGHLPRPWAAGQRTMVLRLRWTELSGRRLGQLPAASELPVQRSTL